jgi:hypothetical protein
MNTITDKYKIPILQLLFLSLPERLITINTFLPSSPNPLSLQSPGLHTCTIPISSSFKKDIYQYIYYFCLAIPKLPCFQLSFFIRRYEAPLSLHPTELPYALLHIPPSARSAHQHIDSQHSRRCLLLSAMCPHRSR